MKAGDAILTIGLLALGGVALYWIFQQYQAHSGVAATNNAAGINAGELVAAAEYSQIETLIQQVGAGSTTVTGAPGPAPVTTAPTAVNPTNTSSGQQ